MQILNNIIWDVNPILIQTGPLELRYYGLLFVTGLTLSYLLFIYVFKKEQLPQPFLDKLLIWAVTSTIIGLRLGHCFFYEPSYFLEHPLEILMIWKGGLASHGAAISIPLGLYVFCKYYKTNYLWLMDRIVMAVAVVGAFVRIGNLMNSEIIGSPTHKPWGFLFVRLGEMGMIPRHPSQIYESLFCIVLFCMLFYIYKYLPKLRNRQGFMFGLFMTTLFLFRFCIEFLKEPQTEWEKSLIIDMGQILSIPFILIGLYLIVKSLIGKPCEIAVYDKNVIKRFELLNSKKRNKLD